MPREEAEGESRSNRYQAIIERIFFNHYKPGRTEFEFEREEIVAVGRKLGIKLPKNLGDILYSSRFRSNLPAPIAETQPQGMGWHRA